MAFVDLVHGADLCISFVGVLQAALNGSRSVVEHPMVPTTAEALAVSAGEVVAAGASAIHLHPRDRQGLETLGVEEICEAVAAVRGAAPTVPVGVSSGAWIVPNAAQRIAAIGRWPAPPVGPDMVSVNLSEPGAVGVIETVLGASIAVEAGIWSPDDVGRLAASGYQHRVERVLVEIVHPSTDPTGDARAIDAELDRLHIRAPRLHHGENDATWPVLHQAVQLGWDTRIGFEDTLRMPDGSIATSNAQLVAYVRALSPHP